MNERVSVDATLNSRLAIDGGPPEVSLPLPAWPIWDEQTESAVLRSLRQGTWWRGAGSEVELFEAELSTLEAAPHMLAVANGTVALEIALQAHGVGPGSKVALPALTFYSTLSAIQRLGATPIVVDVDAETWNLSAQAFGEVAGQCDVVVPVHMAGVPCDMSEIERIAREQGVIIVQDCAHATGMKLQGRPTTGTRCFSFQNAKLLSGGEGGAIAFDDEAAYQRAFLAHNCGRGRREAGYDHRVIATNGRLAELSGALLRDQLQRFDALARRRARGAARLSQLLSANRAIEVQAQHPAGESAHYMMLLRLNRGVVGELSRDWVVDALKAEGVPAFRIYPPVFETKAYWLQPEPATSMQGLNERCPVAVRLGADGIWLHHQVFLMDDDGLAQIVQAIDKVCASS